MNPRDLERLVILLENSDYLCLCISPPYMVETQYGLIDQFQQTVSLEKKSKL